MADSSIADCLTAGPLPSCRDLPTWFLELLICPQCGHERLEFAADQLECPVCGACHSCGGGIVRLLRSESLESVAAQQDAWRVVERCQGKNDLSLDQVLALPGDPVARELLDWLRSVLRRRGKSRVLELGAGCGWAARALTEDGHEVIATEIQDDALIGLGCAVSQREHTGQWFGCVLAEAESLPFHSEAFDCVFCFATLRHIVDLERVLNEASRVLRPGGLLIALQEPFRGCLTTPMERLQNCITYRLAHWWLVGDLPHSAGSDILQLRASIGSTLHEACRRVAYCTAAAEAAGLNAVVLPAAVASHLSPDLKSWRCENGDATPKTQESRPRFRTASETCQPKWLGAFASAYDLDPRLLIAAIDRASREVGVDLLPKLFAHWCCVGNVDGVLLARKEVDWADSVLESLRKPETSRELDPILLACSPQGYLPVYGVCPVDLGLPPFVHWLQPQVGFLIPGTETLEITLMGCSCRFWDKPVRVELRLEDERAPLLVFLVFPDKPTPLRIPIPKTLAKRPSILVPLSINLGFIPNDFIPEPGGDTRLLSLFLYAVGPEQHQAARERNFSLVSSQGACISQTPAS